MNRPAAKGWCPGALRPMMSGDGLLVRVRPRLGRLTVEEIEALCATANAHGSGVIDLTSRGNIQVRGVSEQTYDRLLVDLESAKLIDQSAADEERNNIITSPLWQTGDDTERVAVELGARLSELPDLPSKFGFAIDAGVLPMLSAASADIRVERGVSGELIVRPDGVAVGG
ncbi:MAG: precorrin-3B synthase, partial [Hyphomicrobiaceae bacterium]